MIDQIDHNEYPARLKSKSWGELLFILKDAREAYEANPDGKKSGFYLDELNYVANEIHRRRKAA